MWISFGNLVRTIRIACLCLVVAICQQHAAMADEGQVTLYFSCDLYGEAAEHRAIEIWFDPNDEIKFVTNDRALNGTFLENPISHPATIAFAASDGDEVLTLVVHWDFFLPHPPGYDPDSPPATLAAQYHDEHLTPEVLTYVGNCRWSGVRKNDIKPTIGPDTFRTVGCLKFSKYSI